MPLHNLQPPDKTSAIAMAFENDWEGVKTTTPSACFPATAVERFHIVGTGVETVVEAGVRVAFPMTT